jgi:hypothetical protein
MKTWSASIGDDWDDGLWEQMCEGYGADPSAGFDQPAFSQLLQQLWIPLDEEEVAKGGDRLGALFKRFDVDSNGFLSLEEARGAAAAAFPHEQWDDTLWPEMCADYGADPARGLDVAQWERFWADASLPEVESPAEVRACRAQRVRLMWHCARRHAPPPPWLLALGGPVAPGPWLWRAARLSACLPAW